MGDTVRRHGSRFRALLGPWPWWRTVIVTVLAAGVAASVYPAAGEWFTARNQAEQLESFGQELRNTPAGAVSAEIERARQYNQNLPNGPLRDPYAVDENGNPIPLGEGKDAYEAILNPTGSSIMGTLRIPKIDVNLPIRHDTSEASLDAGVGHLYGSGLPVGGTGVHSVLTAHSGIVGDRLFTDLDRLTYGDTFQISVGREVLTYEVDQILTVLPTELDALRQIPGGDYVTLVTCTPTGLNTHRLLVRGHRIPTPAEDTAEAVQAEADQGPGFPWWTLPLPAALLAGIAATRPLARPRTAARLTETADVRVAATWRESGSEPLTAWRAFRSQLGAGQPTGADTGSRSGQSPSGGVLDEAALQAFLSEPGPDRRLATEDALDAQLAGPDEGLFTWCLLVAGEPVAVSTCGYTHEDAALADATALAEAARSHAAVTHSPHPDAALTHAALTAARAADRVAGVRVLRGANTRDHHWALTVDGALLLVALDPARTDDAARAEAERAMILLARAEIPHPALTP